MSTSTTTTTSLFAPVRNHLRAVEALMAEVTVDEHQALQEAKRHLLAAGGKRVRPAVSLLASGAFGNDWDRAVTLGAAVEMLHTATLVHDDLIDGALLRRGIPTLNANWTPAATVLTGDFLFARAASLAAETGNVRVMAVFARTLMALVNGEINQLFDSYVPMKHADYHRRIYAKTASMFELATEAAAVLADANEDDIAAMGTFGRETGMAFQIVDDVLDFVSTAEKLGKPAGDDLRRGIVTLPAMYYFENHADDPDVQALLDGKMGDKTITARVVKAVSESDAIGLAMNDARNFVERGCAAIQHLDNGSVYFESLVGTARYFVDRTL